MNPTDVDPADVAGAGAVSTPTPLDPDPPASGGPRLDAIDGLRAVAALSVVLYHVVTHYNVLTLEYASWEWINRLGNFGVSIFFVISGFLLYRPMVGAYFAGRDEPSRRRFWIRRFARVLPAYWVALSVAGIAGYIVYGDWTDWLTGYALLGNYRGGYGLFGLGVEWTLVIEVSYYLALPAIAAGLRRLAPQHASPERKLRMQLIGLGALYLLAMLLRVGRLWVFELDRPAYGTWFPVIQLLDKTLIGYFDWFALGMAAAVGSAWVASGRTLHWMLQWLADRAGLCWLLAAQTYWVALQLHLPISVFDRVTRIQDFGIAFTYGFVAILMLLPTVFGNADRSWVLRALRSRPLQLLGTISYGVYLWHLIVVKRVEQWTTSGAIEANLFLWLAIVVPVTIAFATASWLIVEKPFIKLSSMAWVDRVSVVGARPAKFGPPAREVRSLLELVGICGLAIAQPALDLLGKNPTSFVSSDVTGIRAIGFAIAVVVAPPIALWVGEVVFGFLMPRLRPKLHVAILATLVGIWLLQIAKSIAAPGPNVLVAIAIVAGVVAMAAFVRSERARQIARYLPIATVFYLVLFLAFSPASNAIFGGEGDVSAAAGIKNPKRVVMVVFDEFPLVSLLDGKGAIDAELYPNIAELAGGSTWYRNSTTIAPYTWIAIPSMVSGQYPTDHLALPTSREWPDTVFTLLSDAYEMNVTEIVTGLCPSSVCTGRRTGGVKSLASTTKDLWTNFSAPHSAEFSFNEDEGTEITLSETRRFIRNIKPSPGPVLDFAHIELPHQPWHYLPTLQDTEVTIGAPGSAYYLWSNQEFADVARQRHLLQVQAVDNLIGDMIAKLKKIGEWDDSLVIFTADHGVAFQEREPLRSVSRANYTDIMWTPTFVHYPGQTEGKVDDRPVQSIDILPTIADVIKAEVPWDMAGRSMQGEPRDETEPLRVYQWGELGFEPTDVLKPTDGREFLEFDGVEGFASVIERQAAPEAESMRVYRRGEWADLIGEPVAGIVEDRDGDELVGLTNYGSYFGVDPTGKIAQWAYGEGTFNRLDRIEPVAVAINGRVAYVTTPSALKREGDALFAFLVPPDLIVAGNNTIEVFLLSGSPDAPKLDPVEINRL